MKLFLVLNEHVRGSHVDYYRALPELVRLGVLEDFRIYSFLARMSEGLSNQAVLTEIVRECDSFQPNAILWLHTQELAVTPADLERVRSQRGRPVMGYWEGDVFKKPYNPIPKNVFNLVKRCEVSFWQGRWHLMDDLRAAGHADMRYVPDSTEEVRFGAMREGSIDFDVVMVANHISSRLPWRTFPGTRVRKRLADLFYKKLGDRFAVFGHNWKGPYARGPINFEDQAKVYQRGRVVLGVNSSFVDYYFSNRLPICMSCGVPIVHNSQKGVPEMFGNLRSPAFFQSDEEAWEKTKMYLDLPQSELDRIGLESRAVALERFSKMRCLRYMSEVLKDHWNAAQKKENVFLRDNLWISEKQL